MFAGVCVCVCVGMWVLMSLSFGKCSCVYVCVGVFVCVSVCLRERVGAFAFYNIQRRSASTMSCMRCRLWSLVP